MLATAELGRTRAVLALACAGVAVEGCGRVLADAGRLVALLDAVDLGLPFGLPDLGRWVVEDV